MKYAIKIGKKWVGEEHKPFIIAEVSGNHNQSLQRALDIIDAAAKTGADAIKLQTYTADTLMVKRMDEGYVINDKKSLWHGRSMYDLYQEAHTPWEWHEALFNRCHELGLECFSSPFDETAVDFLEKLNCPCYKIASSENTDVILLRKVAATGKPVIVSTGLATLSELASTVEILKEAGCKDIILLKCTAAYPANPRDANLKTIPHLKNLFHCEIGLSDHTMGIGVAVASIAFGATLIEKHFTLARSDGGVDSAFSMEPDEFKALVTESTIAWQAIGDIHYGPAESENTKISRRSLFIVNELKKGDKLTTTNVASKRPGYGIPVKFIDQVIGMSVTKDIPYGTPLTWDLIKET